MMTHSLLKRSGRGQITARIVRFALLLALAATAGDVQLPRATAQESNSALYSLSHGGNEAPLQREAPDQPAVVPAPVNRPRPAAIGVERKDEKIKLSGIVSTPEDEKIILGIIAATFPGSSINNKMKVDQAAATNELWLSGVSFTVRQLAMLKNGQARIQDNVVSLTGEAAAGTSYEAVHRALKEELPAGLVVGHTAVRPPATTYVWLAQLQAGNVSISGRVPDRATRQMITQLVNELFPKARFDNTMEVTEGAPENWQRATWLSIFALQFLQSGSVSITDKTIKIDGMPSDDTSLQKITELTASLPGGFTMENHVMVNQPVDEAQLAKR
jgi:hypothetical protein